jgi:hypothetical protein
MSLMFLLFTSAAVWPVLRWHNGARWFVAGACVASGVWAVLLAVMVFSGAGSQLAGTAAESWTASELRRMQPHGWRLANGLRVRYDEDIDHVLVGPGGVLVVETKWSASSWTEDAFMARSLQAAIEQTARNRKTVVDQFHRLVPEDAVRALLVLWSATPFAASLPSPHPLVAVINGAELRRWLDDQTSANEAGFDTDAAWNAVEAQTRTRTERDETNKPRPTIWQMLWSRVTVPLLVALAALYAFELTHLSTWAPLPLVEIAAAVLVGSLGLRFRGLRLGAIGWLTMNLGIVVVLLIVLVAQRG